MKHGPGVMTFPNILLLVFDTARADAFEPYGAPAGATPVVADLARSGRAVEQAFASCNWTLPSHASMFTGSLPGALGLASSTRPEASKGMISKTILDARRDRVLAEVLRRNGYATGAISANPWIHEINGFANGFERFVDIHGRPRPRYGPGVPSKLRWALDAMRATADDGAAEAERLLATWLEDRSDRPFFWFVNLMECHSPYLPPRPFNDLGPIARIRAAREASRYLTIETMYRYSLGEGEIPSDAIARMRRLYANAVRLMDSWLGRVMEMLDRARILDSTLVVVTADHGENLGENHLISHIISMDDRLLRVPLVTKGPADVKADPITSLAELPRLLAEAIGLKDHPWGDAVRPEGVAVAQASGELLIPMTEELVKGWGVSEDAVRAFARTMTCATDGRFKLVRDSTGDHVYDIHSDPAERHPMDPAAADVGQDVLARLRRAVDGALSQTTDASDVPIGDAPVLSGREAAELEERMRLLGYL